MKKIIFLSLFITSCGFFKKSSDFPCKDSQLVNYWELNSGSVGLTMKHNCTYVAETSDCQESGTFQDLDQGKAEGTVIFRAKNNTCDDDMVKHFKYKIENQTIFAKRIK